MTPFELRDLAIAKFGKTDWQIKLSRETGVNLKTVERWHNGEHPIPDRAATQIRAVCK